MGARPCHETDSWGPGAQAQLANLTDPGLSQVCDTSLVFRIFPIFPILVTDLPKQEEKTGNNYLDTSRNELHICETSYTGSSDEKYSTCCRLQFQTK